MARQQGQFGNERAPVARAGGLGATGAARATTAGLRMAFRLALLLVVGGAVAGCSSVYYGFWEKLGWQKRDLFVDRVKDARQAQEETKEQFKTTLERFRELTNTQGGALEAKYNKLNSEYEEAESRAANVRDKIAKVDTVAQDLFAEWTDELKQYSNDEDRRNSENQLRQAKERYQQLYSAMKTAESKMDPVLRKFKDQVLKLKHSLNASAIASLQQTVSGIEGDVAALIRDMEASIREADDFIKQMQ